VVAKVDVNTSYTPSDDVVAREIEGELIIVPIASGIGDIEDERFTLNDTGRAIWTELDGKRNLKDVVELLSAEFKEPADEIERDVVGFVEELVKRGILVEVTKE